MLSAIRLQLDHNFLYYKLKFDVCNLVLSKVEI